MHGFIKLVAVLLGLLTFASPGAGLYHKNPPKHYVILKPLCISNRTKEAWYVDPDYPRCCKCKPCGSDYDIAPDCPEPNYCKTKHTFYDCVSYEDEDRFNAIFNPEKGKQTPVIVSSTVETSLPTESTLTTFDGAAKPDHSDFDIPWMWMAVGIFVAFVIVIALCIYVIVFKKRTIPFHALRKKLCSNSSAASGSAVKLDPSMEEQKELINEDGTCENNVPPPQPTSEFGPPEICEDLGRNITHMGDSSCPQSVEPILSGQSEISCGSRNIVPVQTSGHGKVANFEVHTGGVINIQNLAIYNQGHQSPEQNQIQHQSPPPSHTGTRPLPSGQSARPCFLSPAAGVMPTSVSSTPPRDHHNPLRGIMRRQSSEKSSTSTAGPVENEYGSNRNSESWQTSSAREDQISEWAYHQMSHPQSHSTTEKSFLTSDHWPSLCDDRCVPRASEMSSTPAEPVEHEFGRQRSNERRMAPSAREDQVFERARHNMSHSHSGPVQHSNSTTERSFLQSSPQSDIEPSECL